MQPIASDDVAAVMADAALAEPLNGTADLAGPEPIRQDDLVRRFLNATGDARTAITDPELVAQVGQVIPQHRHRRLPGNRQVQDDPEGRVGSDVSLYVIDIYVQNPHEMTDAMEDALEKVKARGPGETELEDTQARVKKLAGDHLEASPQDIELADGQARVAGTDRRFDLIYSMNLRLPTRFLLLDRAIATLGSVGIELYPDFNVFEVAKPYARAMLLERFTPDRVAARARREGLALGQMALDLPYQVHDILEEIRDGQIEVGFVHKGLDDLMHRLDVVFNNAGVGTMVVGGTVETIDLAKWDLAQDVNVRAMYLVSRAAVPAMRVAGGGSIVNTSSVSACRGSVGRPSHAYAASKGAVLALTRAMAASYGRDRIRVNAICPGTIRTRLTADFIERAEREASEGRGIPLGRVGEPEDIARCALFLASDDAAWISGAEIVVDGGAMAATA